MDNNIVIYGTTWCPDCVRAENVLRKKGVEYLWIDIGKDCEARTYVESVNNGLQIVPTILFPDGDTLSEPSNAELSEKLILLGL